MTSIISSMSVGTCDHYYTLNDFNEILFSESIQYTLDESTEKIIANLANLLGIVNTPLLTKSSVDTLPSTTNVKRVKSSFNNRRDKRI